jgi:carboxyl-terminal processing protease
LAGDVILEIDGTSTEGLSLDKAVEILQGRPGSPVTLKLLHEGTKKIDSVTLNRAVIEVPSVMGFHRRDNGSWDYMMDPERKIGYITITSFIQKTTGGAEGGPRGAQGPGDEGPDPRPPRQPGRPAELGRRGLRPVHRRGQDRQHQGPQHAREGLRGREGRDLHRVPDGRPDQRGIGLGRRDRLGLPPGPRRAAVVGQRSFGKGSVQNILDLDEGNSVLKLTVATYRRPSGKNIHKFKDAKESDDWGVSPDRGLDVKYTPAEYIAWARTRRDQLAPARAREAVSVPRPLPKPEGEGEGEKTQDAEKKPFVDRQLEKAVEVVREKLIPAMPKAAAMR